MITAELSKSLTTLLSELVDGPPKYAYMLNQGDVGLLRSLDRLSAEAASASTQGGGTIAGHVEHLRYGVSLMNRWAGGEENPFATADWSASWKRTAVTDAEWAKLRAGFRDAAHHWLAALETPREVNAIELNGVIGSIAHLAYHLGAIRQIDRTTRGPTADD
ncbi:hypothetical protein [Longimicrobium sp.]|uniref:hypothetical protein n=1 Tax=Longimicrobium sp. TaxID=2029185 RepID=UPI003B3A8F43